MPFVLLILGILFVIVAIRGTQGQFGALLKSEFVGNNSFVVWGSALVILGVIGYIRPIRAPAQAMMGLVLLVIFLANKGFFSQFNAAIRNPTGGQAPSPSTSQGGAIPSFAGGAISAGIGGVALTPDQATAQNPATAPGGAPAPSPAYPLLPGTL